MRCERALKIVVLLGFGVRCVELAMNARYESAPAGGDMDDRPTCLRQGRYRFPFALRLDNLLVTTLSMCEGERVLSPCSRRHRLADRPIGWLLKQGRESVL